MADMKTILGFTKVVPVLAFHSVEEALDVSEVLLEGGIRVLEITLRHPTGLDQIEAVSEKLPDAIVGAGTVMNPDLARRARDAGAVFGVSPGLSPDLVEALQDMDWAFLPGTATASEAMTAVANGFECLKFFPAEQSGGAGFLKSIGAVLPKVTYCPTGGISLAKAPDYLSLPNVPCVGGSWLTSRGSDGTIDLKDVKARVAELSRL